MTNDILEQVAEEYFVSHGYFTQHNIKYKPSKNESQYRVNSDVDLLCYHPQKNVADPSRVIVVNCKSWQGGLTINQFLDALENHPRKKLGGKDAWKHFRELTNETWANALRKSVKSLTGSSRFTHYVVVTRYRGDKRQWESSSFLRKYLPGCDLKIISMDEIIAELWPKLTITPAHSPLMRMLQLIKAGMGEIIYNARDKKEKKVTITSGLVGTEDTIR